LWLHQKAVLHAADTWEQAERLQTNLLFCRNTRSLFLIFDIVFLTGAQQSTRLPQVNNPNNLEWNSCHTPSILQKLDYLRLGYG